MNWTFYFIHPRFLRVFFKILTRHFFLNLQNLASLNPLVRPRAADVPRTFPESRTEIKMAADLHDESLEADLLVAVGLVAVELEVVVEDEAVLHVRWHLDPNGCCTC